MRDIDYAFFSQMGHLNWESLTKKEIEKAGSNDLVINIVKNKELWNMLSSLRKKESNEYSGDDKRLFFSYKLAGEENPVFDFPGWRFLLGVGYGDIYKLYFKNEKEKILNNHYKGSFRGAVFKKDNKIIITFSGGEKGIGIRKDVVTVDEMKIYDRNYAHLLGGYWLYKYVKDNFFEEGDEIHLTGNKHGGFIAQYVYMATGGKDRTVLWNPIGSGINSEIKEEGRAYRELPDLKNILGYSEFDKELIEKIYPKFILEKGWISSAILENDARNQISQIFDEVREKKRAVKKSSVKNNEPIEVLYYILLTLYLYNDDYERKKGQNLMCTYLVEEEWSVHAINRIGAVIDITTGIRTERKRTTKIPPFLYEFPFPTEELNEVILFMNDQGNLEYGKMRREFAKNTLKNIITAQMKILIEDKIFIKNGVNLEIKRETLEEFDIKYYSTGVISSGRKFGLERKLNPKLFKYVKTMRDSILCLEEPYKIIPCEDESEYKEYIKLGERLNVKSLGDIKCGDPLKIYIRE